MCILNLSGSYLLSISYFSSNDLRGSSNSLIFWDISFPERKSRSNWRNWFTSRSLPDAWSNTHQPSWVSNKPKYQVYQNPKYQKHLCQLQTEILKLSSTHSFLLHSTIPPIHLITTHQSSLSLVLHPKKKYSLKNRETVQKIQFKKYSFFTKRTLHLSLELCPFPFCMEFYIHSHNLPLLITIKRYLFISIGTLVLEPQETFSCFCSVKKCEVISSLQNCCYFLFIFNAGV